MKERIHAFDKAARAKWNNTGRYGISEDYAGGKVSKLGHGRTQSSVVHKYDTNALSVQDVLMRKNQDSKKKKGSQRRSDSGIAPLGKVASALFRIVNLLLLSIFESRLFSAFHRIGLLRGTTVIQVAVCS